MAETIHFTDALIRDLPTPDKRTFYRDDKEKGLIVQVTPNGIKTYYLQKNFNGRGQRFLIGRANLTTVCEARIKANELLCSLNKGIDPKDEKRCKAEELRLRDLFELYIKEKTELRPATLRDYEYMWKYKINPIFGDKKLSDITTGMIKTFHKNMPGKYSSNRCLSLIKSLYNYAIKEELFKSLNPAMPITKNKEIPRKRYLKSDELKRFINGIKQVKHAGTRDAFLMLFFTGVRKSNVLEMRWEDVDLRSKVWKIPQTKTGTDITVPLANCAVELLEDRMKLNIKHSPWVFWSEDSASGHVEELKWAWRTLLKEANLENLRIHDLRHNMGTYMITNGADAFTVQRALTHKDIQSTQIYVNLDVEHIREDVNRTVNSMMNLAMQ